MKYIVSLVLLATFGLVQTDAQIHRMGLGLSFASGTEFNAGETGNPGLTLKTWVPLNKSHSFSIVPSVTAYNRYHLETGYLILNNYMFHGDLNAQYMFFQEGTISAIVFGGGNFTYLVSHFTPIVVTGNETLSDARDYAAGGNAGAGLELRMGRQWDFNVSGKYLFSRYPQFIISVEAAYYFNKRRRAYRR